MLASVLTLCAPSAATAAMVQLFDGRSTTTKSPALKASETAAVKGAVSPAAKQHWKNAGATADFQLLSRCNGAFTRAGAKQIAYLYSWCETGHSLGIGGFAIMENGKLVAHCGYDSGSEHDIYRLPDLDGDGLDELAIEAGTTNQGYTVSSMTVLGVRSPSVKKFGRFDTYDDNSGAVETNPTSNAFSYSVELPSKKLQFMQQQYVMTKEKWMQKGKLTACKPNGDEVTYVNLGP